MPEADLDLLLRAAQMAAEIALRHWRNDHATWDKGGGAGPVTEADLEVDAALREMLTAARPDYGWLSEETEDNPARLSARRLFIIDPIDGTRSFAAGERTWAHSLAVVEAGRPTAAVVFLPVHEKLFAADLSGATLNGAALSASPRTRVEGADVLAGKPALEPAHWRGGPLQVTRHFRPSLAYRMALVGQGRFDAMLTLRPAWEWDIAAGALIAEAAGASVSDRLGRPLMFNSPSARLDGVIAAAAGLHGQFLDRLA